MVVGLEFDILDPMAVVNPMKPLLRNNCPAVVAHSGRPGMPSIYSRPLQDLASAIKELSVVGNTDNSVSLSGCTEALSRYTFSQG